MSASDAARLAEEFRSEIIAATIQDLPDYSFYVGTLTRKRTGLLGVVAPPDLPEVTTLFD